MPVEEVVAVVELGVGAFDGVALVRNLADDLFENIFERDDAQRRTVFVDHDGHVYLVRLKLFQQVVDLLVFGHEIGFSQQLLPAEFVAVVDVGQQILDVEDSL